MRYFSTIAAATITILLIGIAIPKLTVHDIVVVDEILRGCAEHAVQHAGEDSLFRRIAILLGESRIANTDGVGMADIEFFTIFRIPLPFETTVFCSRAEI